VNADLQQAIAASERIFEMLDTHTEMVEEPGAEPLAPFERTIEFRNVGFGYEDAAGRILRDVSLTVRAGQMIAIVGRSGAGKTTLVNLLPRFYDVSTGMILIDGVDIRQVTVASLRCGSARHQDTVVFDDSIGRNIAPIARHDAPQIGVAARAPTRTTSSRRCPSYARDGERGRRCRSRGSASRSRGNSQERADLLDEVTSALIPRPELLVQEALSNFDDELTSLVIAHRRPRSAGPTRSSS
jgi:subfamily B ATP-binding cassette protein MsbA